MKRSRDGEPSTDTHAATTTVTSPSSQEPQRHKDEIGDHHEKIIKQFNGKFNCDVTFYNFGPNPVHLPGEAIGASFFGGKFVELRYWQEIPGFGSFNGRATIGFDAVRQVFQSVWVDNMSTGQFVEEGTLGTMADGVQRIELHS